MIPKLIRLAIDVLTKEAEEGNSYEFVNFYRTMKLSKRGRRALLLLLERDPDLWAKPSDLIPATGSETKTTETWKELDNGGFLDVTNELQKNRGRNVSPTRFRLKNDKQGMLRVLAVLVKYQGDFLHIIAKTPYYFTRNKIARDEAFKELEEQCQKK